MSQYRQLHRSFWESATVEQMDPVEKLLYCYLITAPASNMEGLYKTSLRRIAFETGIDPDMVKQLCARLEEKQLAGFRDGWVCVTQAPKHMTDSPLLLKHAEKVYGDAGENIVTWAISIGYIPPERVCIPYPTRLDNTRLDVPTNTVSKITHEETGLPMNETRYKRLCNEWSMATVEKYIRKVSAWADGKGKTVKDAAAYAENWIQRDYDEGKLVKPTKTKDPDDLMELVRGRK